MTSDCPIYRELIQQRTSLRRPVDMSTNANMLAFVPWLLSRFGSVRPGRAPEATGPAHWGGGAEKRCFGGVSGKPLPVVDESFQWYGRFWKHLCPIVPMGSSFRGGARS